jgi:hypothetical protein
VNVQNTSFWVRTPCSPEIVPKFRAIISPPSAGSNSDPTHKQLEAGGKLNYIFKNESVPSGGYEQVCLLRQWSSTRGARKHVTGYVNLKKKIIL